jgi:tight adherence protein B
MTGALVAAVVAGVTVLASTMVLGGTGELVAGARARRRALALRPVGSVGEGAPRPGLWAGLVGAVRKRVVPRLAALTGGDARARRRADRSLPVMLDQVTRQLRSGASLPGAVAIAASAGTDPGTRRLGDDLAAGAPLGPAVVAWHADCPTPARGLATAALSLAGDAGGSVASVLDGVTDTLRDRVALDREVAALSSQARASAAVLVVAPVAFAVLAAAADPRVARVLLGSPLGWACLVAGAVLDAVGALWMSRLVGRSR